MERRFHQAHGGLARGQQVLSHQFDRVRRIAPQHGIHHRLVLGIHVTHQGLAFVVVQDADLAVTLRLVDLRQARDVKTPADLAGVKLRMPAGPGWLALGKGLGVSPTPMAMAEVYLSMKTGTIDGQENPLGLARNNNLHEVSQQFVLTSHLVQPVFYAIAKPFWDKLTPAQQEALRKAARASSKANDDAKLAEEKQMIDFFLKAGLKVTTPDIAAFRASVDKQYVESGLAAKWLPGLKEKVLAVK